MRNLLQLSALVLALSLVALSCKNNDDPPNPFDDPSVQPPADTVEVINFDPNSFEGIHYNVFQYTCANSGCHDGTFEPDFRSIEASYNTLVYQPVIKNDAGGSFTYRVAPGDAANSVLYHRLLVDIDGQSGIMPLVIGVKCVTKLKLARASITMTGALMDWSRSLNKLQPSSTRIRQTITLMTKLIT